MNSHDAWKLRAPDDEFPWCDDEPGPEVEPAEDDPRAEMEAADREAGE